MVETQHCPKCPDGELSRGEGRLDQCGETYLPTVVWGCTICGFARYEPASSRAWLPQFPPPPEPTAVKKLPHAPVTVPDAEPLAA